MTIRRRIAKLEKEVGSRKALTLEVLVGASRGNAECMRRVEAAGEDDPLISLILETA